MTSRSVFLRLLVEIDLIKKINEVEDGQGPHGDNDDDNDDDDDEESHVVDVDVYVNDVDDDDDDLDIVVDSVNDSPL